MLFRYVQFKVFCLFFYPENPDLRCLGCNLLIVKFLDWLRVGDLALGSVLSTVFLFGLSQSSLAILI